LSDYAARNEDVRNQDIVVWHTFGMTHNPRVEDFPVMPVEISTISLKPADFFASNPALDVPQSTQKVKQSVLVSESFSSTESCCGDKQERTKSML
jgi:primary-amine oxidase